MAKLILTGEFEAIDLKHIHGEQIMTLEHTAEQMIARNGGYAWLKLWLKQGVYDLAEVCESISLKLKRNRPSA